MSIAAEPRAPRERAIDIFKGLLVIGMIYCHSLQFFSDQEIYPGGQRWIDIINLITFSGFVFSFGYVSQLAYYTRSFRQAAPRMLLSAAKTLAAFYVSGMAYRLFIDGRVLAWDSVRGVLLVQEMPGWSEFLISFTYLTLLGLLLFVPLRWLMQYPKAGYTAAFLLLAATFIPYGAIHAVKLAPLIGTRDMASFPVVQYFPYYLLGMLFARHRVKWDWRAGAGALIASAVFVVKWLTSGGQGLPERFPPSVYWIAGPALLLYGIYLLARLLERLPLKLTALEAMGRNVLWFLVMSNLLIFTLSASQESYGIIVSPSGSALLAAIILVIAGFSMWIITKPPRLVYAEADRAAGTENAMQPDPPFKVM